MLRELVYVGVFLGIYEEIREHMVQAGGAAASHALSVVSAEQSLRLFHEQTVQTLFIRSDNVMDVFNAYYGGTHFLVPAAVLAWLLWRHPERYARARTALALTTAVAFVCFWLFPVAPPRLLPARFGIVDTLTMASPAGHAEGALISAAGDQYASMPSLHVAWAVWCAVALYPVIRHRALRFLAAAYPVMTVLVVVATGNHYFLDVAAGALLTGVAWVAVTRLGSWAAVRRDRGHITPAEAGPSGRGSRVARGGQPALRARACGCGELRRGVIQPRFCAVMRSGHRAATSRAVDPPADLPGGPPGGQACGTSSRQVSAR